MGGTILETKESRSLGACKVSPGFVSLDIGSMRRSRWGKMLKNSSKKVIPSLVCEGSWGNPDAHRTVMDYRQPGFKGVRMNGACLGTQPPFGELSDAL